MTLSGWLYSGVSGQLELRIFRTSVISNFRPHPVELRQCIAVLLPGISQTPDMSKTPLTRTRFVSSRDNFLTISPRCLEPTPTRGRHLDFNHKASKLQSSIALLHPCRTVFSLYFIWHFHACTVQMLYCTVPVQYLYLIVPFWYASTGYQASLVEPWFVFWRDVVEPKYPWRHQTSLIYRRSVPKRYD